MPPVHTSTRRSVLLIGSEAQPFAKTGGLADVLGALPPALQRLGWDATVVVPRYRGVSAGALVETFPVTVGGYTRNAGFFPGPSARRRRSHSRRLSRLVRPPGPLYGRQRRLHRQ